MLKRHRWQLLLALALVLGSALLYWIHYLLFRDVHHIFLYMVGDLAFVPIEVLVVTLILHRLLERRDRRQRLEKMNREREKDQKMMEEVDRILDKINQVGIENLTRREKKLLEDASEKLSKK